MHTSIRSLIDSSWPLIDQGAALVNSAKIAAAPHIKVAKEAIKPYIASLQELIDLCRARVQEVSAPHIDRAKKTIEPYIDLAASSDHFPTRTGLVFSIFPAIAALRSIRKGKIQSALLETGGALLIYKIANFAAQFIQIERNLHKRVGELKRTRESLEGKITTLGATIAQYQAQNSTFEGQVQAYGEITHEKRAEIGRLEREIGRLTTTYSSMKESLGKMEGNLTDLERITRDQEAIAAKNSEAAERAIKERAALTALIRENPDISARLGEIASREAAIEEKTVALNAKIKELRALEGRLSTTEAKLAQSSEQVELFARSISNISGPLILALGVSLAGLEKEAKDNPRKRDELAPHIAAIKVHMTFIQSCMGPGR